MLPNWFQTQVAFFEKYMPQGDLKILQIGAYTGDATQWILDNRNVLHFDDVDTWEGSDETEHHKLNFSDVEQTWDSRFSHLDNVHKHKMTSDEFFAKTPIGSIEYDFIYIDGDHTALQTALDGLNAFRLLKNGGIIAFDDYWWMGNPSDFLRPKRGIDAFMHICQDKIKIIEIAYQAWFQKC